MFDRLVTPIGGKIAYPTDALAAPEVVGPRVSALAVEAALNKLSRKEARLLKPTVVNGQPGFEIFHDVLGLPVLEWKRNFDAKRQRRRTRRIFGGWALAATALVVVGVGIFIFNPTQFVQLRYGGQVATNQDILTNIVRASFDQPLNFASLRMELEFLARFSQAAGFANRIQLHSIRISA